MRLCVHDCAHACVRKGGRAGQKSERTKHDQFWSRQRHSNKKEKVEEKKKREESRVLTKLRKEVEPVGRGRAGEGRGFVEAVVFKRLGEAGKPQRKRVKEKSGAKRGIFSVNKQGSKEPLSRLMKDGDAKEKGDIIHPNV